MKGNTIPRVPERFQPLAVLGVAIVCGLIASVAVFHFLKRQEQAIQARALAAPPPIQTTPIVIAREDLAPGTVLKRSALQIVEWPTANLPPQSVSQHEDLVGRQVKTKIFRGEPVIQMRLVPPGERAGLEVRIPPGMRAMSLKVDSEIGVSGFIEAGSRVDVIASVPLNGGERLTKVVLQHVLVLAVGHEIESENEKPKDVKTVTLAVHPEEAEKLASARSEGQIMLALRNLQDDHVYETPGFSRSELVEMRPAREPAEQAKATPPKPPQGEQAEEPEPPPPPKYHVVELIEGDGVAQQLKFEIR